MPMCNEDRTVWITYNGEIYNFAELRRELQSKGHHFASNTDTEVVIHLYEQEGADCVQRLNGMFAFAICDLRSGKPELFLARDHFGVKPFYYAHRGRKLAFASEVKALLHVPEIEAEIDLESLHQYLTFLWVPDPKTMFRGIYKLPAGHCATFRDGELKIRQYWDLTLSARPMRSYPRSEADLADEVRERFRRSVEAQMVSDVPIGAFLSAGLGFFQHRGHDVPGDANSRFAPTRLRSRTSIASAKPRSMIPTCRRGWRGNWAVRISRLWSSRTWPNCCLV